MSATVIETTHGPIEGRIDRETIVFRGIPYGRDTSGDGRFRHATRVQKAAEQSLNPGPRAWQVVPEGRGPAFYSYLADPSPMSEDCLHLNVFAPMDTARPKPVMVWLHGGAWISGSGNRPCVHGSALAQKGDVVVVTLNHRLNAFGFTWDGTDATDPNVGMTDIVSALEWVRDNIAAFGGDPECVTIFGQSGGGAKVSVLLAMPSARGLFHRAVVQSASLHLEMATPERAIRCAHLLYEELGLTPGNRAGLADIPAEAILKARLRAVERNGGIDDFRPVLDGTVLPFDPYSPEGLDHHNDIPLLIGWTANEMSFFLGVEGKAVYDMDEVRARAIVAAYYNMKEAETAPLYDAMRGLLGDVRPAEVAEAILSDSRYGQNCRIATDRKADHAGAPVYHYRIDWTCAPWGGVMGAPHTVCIPLVFGTTDTARELLGRDAEADALSDRMLSAWTNFARTGNPATDRLPDWPRYDTDNRQTMVLDAECRVARDPARPLRELTSAWPKFEVGMILKGIRRAV